AFPIQTASGYLLGSITRDITERKRIELERDTARQLFQKMFELSPVAIALSSVAERRIVDVNTATERLLGYSRAELIGQHSPAIDYWADPEERQHAFETLLAEGRIARYEFTFKTKSGRTGRALIFAELFEQQGEQYILSAFVDITELQSYREHLEELVAERTARLQQSLEDLRRFALLAADRELRIKELREENKRLREQLKAAGRDIL
ncbi:MAG: PAS domain S-box protein, partial [Chloroflexi bacterium]